MHLPAEAARHAQCLDFLENKSGTFGGVGQACCGADPIRPRPDLRKWGQALQASHPFVASKLLLGLANTYDRQASHEDEEARIRQRLR